MSEDKEKTKEVKKEEKASVENKEAVEQKSSSAAKSRFQARGRNTFRGRQPKRAGQEEFEQRIVDIARVTRVMAGGKRMRFRACVAIGDKKGRVAVGLDKGADVTIAITKAVNQAKKNFIQVPIYNDTIPHDIYHKLGAAKILLKPARKGRGIIAGGAVRIVLELAGIKNVTSKILGTKNKVNIVKCTISALDSLKKKEEKEKKQIKAKAKKDNK